MKQGHSGSTFSPNLERNVYIDTLRGLAIWGVVCVHFAGSFVAEEYAWTSTFYVGLTLNLFFSFAVPLFVFLSGLLAGMSRKQSRLSTYYLGRFRRIVLPYLVASLAAFFVMNHHAEWQELSTGIERFQWILYHLGWVGIEPTFYFIPLVIQLYLILPLLRALPKFIHKRFGAKIRFDDTVANIAFVLLIVHVLIGLLCYFDRLSYYHWGRPFALFWLFYFFVGLHFDSLRSTLTERIGLVVISMSGLVGISVFGFLLTNSMDPNIVGVRLENNEFDKAYVRPAIMLMNLAFILVISGGIVRRWQPPPNVFTKFGPASLSIYLWHIMLIYVCIWSRPPTMQSVTLVPELLAIIPLCVCFILFWLGQTPKFLATKLRLRNQ